MDGKILYFKVGNTKMIYESEEFCLIIGFNFGCVSKTNREKVLEKQQIGWEKMFIAGTKSQMNFHMKTYKSLMHIRALKCCTFTDELKKLQTVLKHLQFQWLVYVIC